MSFLLFSKVSTSSDAGSCRQPSVLEVFLKLLITNLIGAAYFLPCVACMCMPGSQSEQAFSKDGLTRILCACSIADVKLVSMICLGKPTLLVMILTWDSHLRFPCMVTPRYFAFSLCFRSFLCSIYIERNLFLKPAIMAELRLQKPAPEFRGTAVVDGEIKDISLADYRGKYVVFFFYPMDFTFVCPTEIIAFSDRVEEFRAIDCEVIACSCDSQFSHLAWINTPRKQGGLGNMKIPLLSDKTLEISRAYGALKEDEGISFRALFIIDGKGNLRQITMNDLPVGRSVDETLRLVQAFKFTDEHGEVCPAGWKPGKDTIKPDVKGKMSYFQKQN